MTIDILFLVILIFAVIRGLRKGLVAGVFSLLAFIIGLAAALKLSAVVANYLADNTGIATKWLPVVSFLVVFIGVIIIINILAKMIEKAMEITMLGFVNRIGGVIFYVLIDTFIFSIVLFYANQLHFISDKTIADSFCYGYIEPLAPKVMEVLAGALPFLKNVFTDLEKFFSGIAGEPLK